MSRLYKIETFTVKAAPENHFSIEDEFIYGEMYEWRFAAIIDFDHEFNRGWAVFEGISATEKLQEQLRQQPVYQPYYVPQPYYPGYSPFGGVQNIC